MTVLCYARAFSHVRLFVTPRAVVRQAPLSMGFSRQEYWSALLQGSSQPRDQTQVPCFAGGFFTI